MNMQTIFNVIKFSSLIVQNVLVFHSLTIESLSWKFGMSYRWNV